MGTWIFHAEAQRGPQQVHSYYVIPANHKGKRGSDSIYYFFFLSPNGRDWTYLQYLRLLDSPLSYLLLSEFKGSLVGLQGDY